jgi:hypothetical protein
MLHSVSLALAAAFGLFALERLGNSAHDALWLAAPAVAVGIALACLASGAATWMTVAAGALSALVFSLLHRTSLGLAAAAAGAMWLWPRALTAPTRRSQALSLATGAGAASLAGFVFAAYEGAPPSSRWASCVFAGSTLALATIVAPVGSAVAHALHLAASVIEGPARLALTTAASMREQLQSTLRLNGTERAAWRKLTRLADQRAALQTIETEKAAQSRAELDMGIEQLVTALTVQFSGKTPSQTSDSPLRTQLDPLEATDPLKTPDPLETPENPNANHEATAHTQ